MSLIGLTGGIATGKSLVANFFNDLGIEIVDADLLAREVVEPGKIAYNEIVKKFGEGILEVNGTINRKLLGSIIFSDKKKRLALTQITHPRIFELQEDKIKEFKEKKSNSLLIIDAALLIESGFYKKIEILIVVTAKKEIQISRMFKRDKISRKDALLRINSQMPVDQKAALAHFVIHNDGDIITTKKQVKKIFDQIKLGTFNKKNW